MIKRNQLQDLTQSGDLYHVDLPKGEEVLGPMFRRGYRGLLYAPTGVGKTYFCMKLAHHLSAGFSFLGFSPKRQMKVLYVEAEMLEHQLQDRHRAIYHGAPVGAQFQPANLKFLSGETLKKKHKRSLHRYDQQKYFLEICKDFDFVIFDNLFNLTKGGSEAKQEAKTWESVDKFLDELQKLNIATLMVHHTNAAGVMNGTQTKRNDSDVIIRLDKSILFRNEKRFGIEVHFEKVRMDKEPGPFYIKIDISKEQEPQNYEHQKLNGSKLIEKAFFKFTELEEEQVRCVNKLSLEGNTEIQIASELGLRMSFIKWAKRNVSLYVEPNVNDRGAHDW